MKGIVIEKNGGPDVMQFTELSLQKPGPGQARVKVMASGLNFIDIYQRRGDYPVQLPYTPGLEGSGVVEEVGADVTVVKPGRSSRLHLAARRICGRQFGQSG